MFARAACALTPHKGQLSDSAYFGLGLAAFVLAFGIEYGLFHRMLRSPLRTHELAVIRPAINRWLIVTIVWQVLVIGGCAVYLVALGSRHGRSVTWIAPPVGAAFGIALPLQFVVSAIFRAVRGSL